MAWRMLESEPGGESSRHRTIKQHIFTRMSVGGWSVEKECSIISRGTRRADLGAEDGRGRRVAVEVQVSSLDLMELQRKLDFYAENDIGALYVVDEGLIAGLDYAPVIATIDGKPRYYNIDHFLRPELCSSCSIIEGSPPKFVKALNGCGYGKVAVWLEVVAENLGIAAGVYLVHFGQAIRWVKPFGKRGGYYGRLKRRSFMVIGPRIDDWSASEIAVSYLVPMGSLLRQDEYVIAGFPMDAFWRSQHDGG